MNTTTFEALCASQRTAIKELGKAMLALKEVTISMDLKPDSDRGEMIANVTLAYRHLEDAAMRIGKAIQAYEGGKSIYDNKDAERVAGLTIKSTEVSTSAGGWTGPTPAVLSAEKKDE